MLAVDRVGAAYGSSSVLYDVDLKVGEGEAVALLGRNGVGKTTLPDDHRSARRAVRWLRRPRRTDRRTARLGIGYVRRGRGIAPHLTVAGKSLVGSAASSGGGKRSTFPIDELFPGLAKLRDRKGGVLSGGEQQQVALARALAGSPKLLLLDEPTDGIQPNIVAEIGELLDRLRKEFGVAILLVEQHLDFAWARTDRYYVMQRGRVVRDGTTTDASPDDISYLLGV